MHVFRKTICCLPPQNTDLHVMFHAVLEKMTNRSGHIKNALLALSALIENIFVWILYGEEYVYFDLLTFLQGKVFSFFFLNLVLS